MESVYLRCNMEPGPVSLCHNWRKLSADPREMRSNGSPLKNIVFQINHWAASTPSAGLRWHANSRAPSVGRPRSREFTEESSSYCDVADKLSTSSSTWKRSKNRIGIGFSFVV